MIKKVTAHVEKGKDGIYSVYMFDEELDYSVNGQGKTADEAIADFIAVYKGIKCFYEEENRPFTEAEFEYKYDISASLASYAEVFTLGGLSRITGIDKSRLSKYIKGTSSPSVRTTERINKGIRNYASRLAQMVL